MAWLRYVGIVTVDGDTQYWATSKIGLDAMTREVLAAQVWSIETYHRGLKQFCGAERAQVRAARAQRNHIGFAIRAFVRLEHHRIRTGTRWLETKMGIIRAALPRYLTETSPILVGRVQNPATAYLLTYRTRRTTQCVVPNSWAVGERIGHNPRSTSRTSG